MGITTVATSRASRTVMLTDEATMFWFELSTSVLPGRKQSLALK